MESTEICKTQTVFQYKRATDFEKDLLKRKFV